MSFITVSSLPGTGVAGEIYKLPDNSFWFYDTSQSPAEWFSIQSQLISPMSFGAYGNGVNDDKLALQKCIDFCRDNHHILFIERAYRTTESLLMHNIKVLSNNGKIIGIEDEPAPGDPYVFNDYIIKAEGSADSDSELLTVDVLKGTQYLTCESLEDVVTKGDLIRVYSDKLFSTEESVKQGEIQKVDEVIIETVESIDYLKIKIYGAFEDSYLMTDNAKIAKVNPCFFEVSGVLTIEGNPKNKDSKALNIFRVDNANVNIKVVNTASVGVGVADCFKPVLQVDICGNGGFEETVPGLGYGLSVGRCTMYGLFTGNSFGAKHAFTTTANTNHPGVSWGNRITNFTGSSSISSGIFDSHASTGSVYFSNCTAIGYREENIENEFTNFTTGFSVEAAFTSIENCRVYNCIAAVYCFNAKEINTLVVSDLIANNTKFGLLVNGSGDDDPTGGCIIENLIFTNVKLLNDYDIHGGTLMSVSKSTIHNWETANLFGIGVGSAIRIGGFCAIPGIQATNVATKFYNPHFSLLTDWNEDNCFISLKSGLDFVRLMNCRSNAPLFLYTFKHSHELYIPEITLTDVVSESPVKHHMKVYCIVDDFSLIRSTFKNSNQNFAYVLYCDPDSDVARITIKDTTFEGNNIRGIYVLYSTYGLVDIDNTLNNYLNTLIATIGTNWPSIWITKGSFTKPERIIGLGSPITASVAAPVGCVYVNLESLTDHTIDRNYFKMPDDPSNPTPFNGWKLVTMT